MARKRTQQIQDLLVDGAQPVEQRASLLHHLAVTDPGQFVQAVQGLLEKASAASTGEVYQRKLQELQAWIQELQAGPLRYGSFLEMISSNGCGARALVRMEDGTSASIPVADVQFAQSLQTGDTVLIEAGGKLLTGKGPDYPAASEEARLERRLDEQRVEVVVREQETPLVLRVAQRLREKLDRREVPSGSRLLVCTRRQLAFDVIPTVGDLYDRHLSKEPLPDVRLERDIGCPPAYIRDLGLHVYAAMIKPELVRALGIRRCQTRLLVGPSGTGKSLSILAFIRLVLEIAAEVCGVPVETLPRRVMRVQVSQILSKWLGDSDKNVDEFFDAIDHFARQEFVGPDGHRHELPLLVVFEEADALGRSRDGHGDGAYGRILTTLLQRLDLTVSQLKDRLVIFLFTSNVPRVLDPAFMRRAATKTERFGRLDRRGFVSVLEKVLGDRLLLPFDGEARPETRRRLVSQITAWAYGPNSDRGQVELQSAGHPTPVIKYRRDFMTGGLIDRAVQQASQEACHRALFGNEKVGVTPALLMAAISDQVTAIVNVLDSQNAHEYLTLPDDVRVTSVRRIEQPTVVPTELETRP